MFERGCEDARRRFLTLLLKPLLLPSSPTFSCTHINILILSTSPFLCKDRMGNVGNVMGLDCEVCGEGQFGVRDKR